ncbi:MAG: MarR family transcriptional regulator [Proteobacteria bacterium]|nr:MarR family transcriptional regulator [Pseudomonadota bacterium]
MLSSTSSALNRFADGYLAALLAQASHLISEEFHTVVRQHGFTVSEWRTLATLSDGRDISIGKLAQITLHKQPTLTRLIIRMEKRGQIRRLDHDRDGRVTLVRITPAGRRKVAQLIRLARQHERRVLEPFGLERSEQLKATLRRIIELHARGVAG